MVPYSDFCHVTAPYKLSYYYYYYYYYYYQDEYISSRLSGQAKEVSSTTKHTAVYLNS